MRRPRIRRISPLKKIDSYIFRKFLSTFLFTTVILLAVAGIIDVSEHIGSFIDHQIPLHHAVFGYYVHFFLFYGNTFIPIIIFVSVILVTSKMSSNSEIIAILSGGVSFKRLMLPYMVVAFLIAFVSFLTNHWILPHSNKIRKKFEYDYFYTVNKNTDNLHKQIGKDTYVYLQSFTSDSESGYLFSYEKFKDNKLQYKVMADNVSQEYEDSSSFFRMIRYKFRDIKHQSISESNVMSWSEDTVSKVLSDNREEISKGYSKDTIFDFDLQELVPSEYAAETMDYIRLREFIARERFRGSPFLKVYLVQMNKRTSLPFCAFFLTVIGVSLSVRKSRGGVGMNIALGLALVVLYVFFMKLSDTFAIKSTLSPLLAVWIPNFSYIILAGFLYQRAKR